MISSPEDVGIDPWLSCRSGLCRASGCEHLGGWRAVVRRARSPQGGDGPSDHDGVAAELAGVLLGSREAMAAGDGTGVEGDRPGRVDPPPRGSSDAEAAVEAAVGVREHAPGPAEVACDGDEPVDRAEADHQQAHVRVIMKREHLDQVLLTGESVPMSQQHEDLGSRQRAERELAATGFDQRDLSDIDGDLFGDRHLRLHLPTPNPPESPAIPAARLARCDRMRPVLSFATQRRSTEWGGVGEGCIVVSGRQRDDHLLLEPTDPMCFFAEVVSLLGTSGENAPSAGEGLSPAGHERSVPVPVVRYEMLQSETDPWSRRRCRART